MHTVLIFYNIIPLASADNFLCQFMPAIEDPVSETFCVERAYFSLWITVWCVFQKPDPILFDIKQKTSSVLNEIFFPCILTFGFCSSFSCISYVIILDIKMDWTKNLIKYVSMQKLFTLLSHHFDCFNKFSLHNSVKKRLDLWAQTFVCRCNFLWSFLKIRSWVSGAVQKVVWVRSSVTGLLISCPDKKNSSFFVWFLFMKVKLEKLPSYYKARRDTGMLSTGPCLSYLLDF